MINHKKGKTQLRVQNRPSTCTNFSSIGEAAPLSLCDRNTQLLKLILVYNNPIMGLPKKPITSRKPFCVLDFSFFSRFSPDFVSNLPSWPELFVNSKEKLSESRRLPACCWLQLPLLLQLWGENNDHNWKLLSKSRFFQKKFS